MKLNALILAAAILLGFAVTWALESGPPPAQAPEAVKPAAAQAAPQLLPDFSVTALDGTVYRSRDFAGKTLLINFWASWCAPCVEEFPRLLALARLYPDDLALLALSSDQDAAAIERFTATFTAEDKKILAQKNVILVHDGDSRVTFGVFRTERFPETIIVGPDQTMIDKLVGADWSIDDVRAMIEPSDKSL